MTKRPLKFKLDAYNAYNSGMTPVEAFEEASRLNDKIALSGCMTTKSYASSYMSDDIRRFIRDRRELPEVLEYFETHSLDISEV